MWGDGAFGNDVTWTAAELALLRQSIRENGVDDWRTLGDWSQVAASVGGGKTAEQCFDRWCAEYRERAAMGQQQRQTHGVLPARSGGGGGGGDRKMNSAGAAAAAAGGGGGGGGGGEGGGGGGGGGGAAGLDDTNHPSFAARSDGYENAHHRQRTTGQDGRAFVGRWPYAVEPDVPPSMFLPGRQPPGSRPDSGGKSRSGAVGQAGRGWDLGGEARGGGDATGGLRREDHALRNLALVAKAASEGEGGNEG